MKYLILAFTFTSCGTGIFTEHMLRKVNYDKSFLESEVENCYHLVNSGGYDKRNVNERILLLDSLFKQTWNELKISSTNEETKKILSRWKAYGEPSNMYGNIMMPDINLDHEFYVSSALLELVCSARYVVRSINLDIDAQLIPVDEPMLIIKPERTNIRLGESYKAQILYGLTSKSINDIFDVFIDNNPVEYSDGHWEIEITPDSKGVKYFTAKIESKQANKQGEKFTVLTTAKFSVK
jgi:hypothetical protein